MGKQRSTLSDGFRFIACFLGGKAWDAPALTAHLEWSKSKVDGFLATGLAGHFLERNATGPKYTYNLSNDFIDQAKVGLASAERRDVAYIIKKRTDDIERAIHVQLDHLTSELTEVF